jgi:hypothetical protein
VHPPLIPSHMFSYNSLSPSPYLITTAAVVFCCGLLLHRRDQRQRLRAAMPPGPPPCWLGFGDNRRDLQGDQFWKTYSVLHARYGTYVPGALGRLPQAEVLYNVLGSVISVVIGTTNIIGTYFVLSRALAE